MSNFLGGRVQGRRYFNIISTLPAGTFLIDSASNQIHFDDQKVEIGEDNSFSTLLLDTSTDATHPFSYYMVFPGRESKDDIPVGPFPVTSAPTLADLANVIANPTVPPEVRLALEARVDTLQASVEEYLPSSVTHTLTTGVVPSLGTSNKWIVPSPITVALPPSPPGSTFVVHLDKIQNVTWPVGATIVGKPPKLGAAWVSLIKEAASWTVLISGPAASGGLPTFDPAHPLFSPGNGDGANLSAFNDFFGLNAGSLIDLTPDQGSPPVRYPFLGAAGGYGVATGSLYFLWFDDSIQKFVWASLELLESKRAISGFENHAAYGLTNTFTGMGNGIQALQPTILHVGDTYDRHWTSVTTYSVVLPSLLMSPADLAQFAGVDNGWSFLLPSGTMLFIASLNKPVWRGMGADNEWVDSAGVRVWPVI